MNQTHESPSPKRLLSISAVVFILIGAATALGGIRLVALHGSWYYLLAGLGVLATGALLLIHRRAALWLYAVVVLGTTFWALYEVKLDWWQLLPRVDVWFVLGLWLLLVARTRPGKAPVRSGARPLVVALLIAAVVGIVSLFVDVDSIHGRIERSVADTLPAQTAIPGVPEGDWRSYGGTSLGQRFSPLKAITPENAHQLQLAWRFETGDKPGPDDPFEITSEDTPLKVGDTLYLCTPHSLVIALDATTGKEQWRFDPKIQSPTGSFKKWEHMTCRGVAYHDDADYGQPAVTPAVAGACPRRLLLPTADARLIALNADNGRVCTGFGDQGTVNLLTKDLSGNVLPGGYYSTSPPAVTRDLVIIGGHVTDNYSTDEPSGVIRAFDVHDGHLVWNWDPGRPDDTTPLQPGQLYTHNSPNVWSVMSVDENLGLVYLPMGNQTPDQWGGDRTPESEKFSAGLVALDVATGKLRWNYQFTHHDLWDMDVSAQPTLVDLKTPQGIQPAVISTSKQGSIYVLNRETGQPIIPIREISRPSGAVSGDRTSPTQPMSDLNFSPPDLTEASMWGTTPFDQLYCRIKFRSLRYEGMFTPPSIQGSIIHPGNAGVFDWGGVSVDPERQIAFTNPNSMAFVSKLVPKAQIAAMGEAKSETSGVHPNTGAPYGAEVSPLLTPWGLPCQAPPWGYVAGVDLVSGKVVWKHKNGTTRDTAPFGIPLPLGIPGQGGTLITAGGVAFYGATMDYYLRAYDVSDGKELWEARLPAGGQATPMSYRGKDGRQYIVIFAGGHGSLGAKLGDSVMAYALPQSL